MQRKRSYCHVHGPKLEPDVLGHRAWGEQTPPEYLVYAENRSIDMTPHLLLFFYDREGSIRYIVFQTSDAYNTLVCTESNRRWSDSKICSLIKNCKECSRSYSEESDQIMKAFCGNGKSGMEAVFCLQDRIYYENNLPTANVLFKDEPMLPDDWDEFIFDHLPHYIFYDALQKGNFREFKKNIKAIAKDYENIKTVKKELPRVGIVGEILIKYHHFGNDNLILKLEAEGSEVCLPDLMGFVKYCAYNNVIKSKLLKQGKVLSAGSIGALKIIEYYEKTIKDALKNTKYRSTVNIYELANNVDGILSTGNQTGEGWFLTAEMIELIKDGIENIVCVQPFACLPNHIVGKAVIKKIRSIYPNANIVAIDYDPGASHTNQVNRIKLMLTVAKEKEK